VANINLIGVETTTGLSSHTQPGDTVVDIDENVLFTIPKFTGALARQSSVDSIGNTTDTTLTFDSTDFDTNSFFSLGNASRLTTSTAGTYRIIASVGIETNSTGDRSIRVVQFDSSDTEKRRLRYDNQANSVSAEPTVSQVIGIAQTAADDYFTIEVFQDSGTTLDTVTAQTWFSIQRLA